MPDAMFLRSRRRTRVPCCCAGASLLISIPLAD
jgi:hypothetical protein